MITWIVFGAVIAVIIVIAIKYDKINLPPHYPLLDGREADAAAWRLPGIEPTIIAAYLENIRLRFDLRDNIYKFRPTDSLYALYNSYYGPFPKKIWRFDPHFGMDDMELEDLLNDFEELCAPEKPHFNCELPLNQLLQIIADARANRPLTLEEQKKLGVKMSLLSEISGETAV